MTASTCISHHTTQKAVVLAFLARVAIRVLVDVVRSTVLVGINGLAGSAELLGIEDNSFGPQFNQTTSRTVQVNGKVVATE